MDKVYRNLVVIYEKETDEDLFKAINLANKKYRIFVGLNEQEISLVIARFMTYIQNR